MRALGALGVHISEVSVGMVDTGAVFLDVFLCSFSPRYESLTIGEKNESRRGRQSFTYFKAELYLLASFYSG